MSVKGMFYLLLFTLSTGISWPAQEHIQRENLDLIREFPYVYRIYQSRDGFLWIGNSTGLSRFDGYSFQNYHHHPGAPDSLSNNFVLDILEDDRGGLWLATYGGGLNRFDPRTRTFRSWSIRNRESGHIPGNRLTCLCSGRGRLLWIGTADGQVFRFDPDTEELNGYSLPPVPDQSEDFNTIADIHRDPFDILWIATRGNGLVRFNPQTEKFTVHQPDRDSEITTIPANVLNCLHPGFDGELWIGSNGRGLKKFDPATGIFHTYNVDPRNTRSLTLNDITSIIGIRGEKLLVGTNGGGLYRFDLQTETFEKLPLGRHSPGSPSLEYIETLHPGPGGDLWVGLLNGSLIRYNPNSHHFVNYLVKKVNRQYRQVRSLCLLEDRRGDLWVGTDGEGLIRYHRKKGFLQCFEQNLTDPRSLSSNYITYLWEDPDGGIWIGTWGGGLNRYDPDRQEFTDYRFPTGESRASLKNTICCIAPENGDHLWLGTLDGVYRFSRSHGRFETFYHNSDRPGLLSEGVVYALLEGTGGNLWIGSQRGLVRYNCREGKFQELFPVPGSTHRPSFIRALFEDRDQTLWIGTQDRGLYRLPAGGKVFDRFTAGNGLPGDSVLGIQQDASGMLWVSTGNGLCRMDPGSGHCRNFNRAHGLSAKLFTKGCWTCDDGEMLFGHINGITGFFPGEISDRAAASRIAITDVRKLSDPVGEFQYSAAMDQLRCRHDDAFTVSFSDLSYRHPDLNQYRYRIMGLDHRWVDLGPENKVTFSHLKPGRYVFEATETSHGETQSAPVARLPIQVLPPFWGSPVFKLALILAIGAGVLAFYRIRITRLQKQMSWDLRLRMFCEQNKISEREMEIIQLLLKGKSNREIEEKLFISLHTVKNHLYNIYQKLKIENRHQLMALFHREVIPGPRHHG